MIYLLRLEKIVFVSLLLSSFCFPSISIAQEASNTDLSDTLRVVRSGLITHIYLHEERLANADLVKLYHKTPDALKLLKKAQPMRISGPVLALGGVALGTVALKGEHHVTTLEGKDYYYTERSKGKLIGGLLLLAGGICLFEFSNDLVARSGKSYNRAYIAKKLLSKTTVNASDQGIGIVVSLN